MLQASTYQMAVLLHFNTSEILTYSYLLESTQLKEVGSTCIIILYLNI